MKIWPELFSRLLLIIVSSLLLATVNAQETLRQELSKSIDIIEHPTLTETARLKVVSVKESHKNAIKQTNRIAGYPITDKLANLDKQKSQQLAKLLLDKNNYANIQQRCLNDYFHGIRFSKDQQKIEFALGIPCNQVVAVFHDREKINWWGGVLGNDAARKVVALLGE